jgi:hypothetical protein
MFFKAFAAAERAQLTGVFLDVAADFGWAGPRVWAQRPADGFAEEELARIERGLDAGVQIAAGNLAVAGGGANDARL